MSEQSINRRKLTELQREISTELDRIRAFTDKDLSGEGLQKRKADMLAKARQKFEPEVTRLRTLIDGEADAAAQHLEKARPQVGNDPQSLLRLQQRWDQVRMRLDSGASLQRVIASADADTLTAIREWAPTWLAAQADSARPAGMEGLEFDDPDVAPIMRSLDERLAEVSGNGFSTVNQRAKEAAGDAAYAASVAPRLEGQLQGINVGSDGLTAAVEAHYAAANATAGLPPPDDDGGES